MSYRAIAIRDRLGFLADLARQLEGIPDGTEIRFEVTESLGEDRSSGRSDETKED